jgi:hypothetical protein
MHTGRSHILGGLCLDLNLSLILGTAFGFVLFLAWADGFWLRASSLSLMNKTCPAEGSTFVTTTSGKYAGVNHTLQGTGIAGPDHVWPVSSTLLSPQLFGFSSCAIHQQLYYGHYM